MTSEELLKQTSRAFYLSLRILPGSVRPTISLAYLLARTADTVSDSEWLPQEHRRPALELLVGLLNPPRHLENWQALIASTRSESSAETRLLHHLPLALQALDACPEADRHLICEIVTTLAQGMHRDLERFPGSVQDSAELQQHLWAAAGCVGSFWSRVLQLHYPTLAKLPDEWLSKARQLGDALQITNVLRDIPGDIAEGRCYLPLDQLRALGLQPDDLRNPMMESRVAPLFQQWVDFAIEQFHHSRDYVLWIPARHWRLRLAALWPWVLGLATLRKLLGGGWLARKQKVPRSQVYRILLSTLALVFFDPLLRRYMDAQLGWTKEKRN